MPKDEKPQPSFWDGLSPNAITTSIATALAERWQISLHFLDTKGYLQFVEPGKFFSPSNGVCQVITEHTKGYQDRRETAFRLTTEVGFSDKKKITKCVTGTAVFAVPLVAKGQSHGIIYADGFFTSASKDQGTADTLNYLSRIDAADKKNKSKVKDVAVLSEADLSFLEHLLDVVATSLLIHKFGNDYESKELPVENEEIQNKNTVSSNKVDNKAVIGSAPKMLELFETLDKVKDTESPILITGENGTGKEMIANKIHRESRRAKGKFVAINCGAFNENLLESELFGHVKGAFTGAEKDKKGLFEAANNGTLFLDEVGEMNLNMQVKLLRALQEKSFTPVGSVSEKKHNARIIAATNKDLRKLIKEKQFREDLFYRLNVINITSPALRERKEDIPVLINHFLEKHHDKIRKTMHSSAVSILQEYSWPGNVRQLENEIRRALVLSDGEEIQDGDLSERIVTEVTKSGKVLKINDRLQKSFEEQEKQLIINGLKRTKCNKSALAKELGMSRSTLDQRIKKYGINLNEVG